MSAGCDPAHLDALPGSQVSRYGNLPWPNEIQLRRKKFRELGAGQQWCPGLV